VPFTTPSIIEEGTHKSRLGRNLRPGDNTGCRVFRIAGLLLAWLQQKRRTWIGTEYPSPMWLDRGLAKIEYPQRFPLPNLR
jgi:hypothetical protein